MKTNLDMRMTPTKKSGERMLIRLGSLGLTWLLMVVPTLGLASVLSELAATVEPGTFVELEVEGSVSTCQAMVPPVAVPRDYLGNILEFTDEALWDPVGREVYIMGTRRPYKTEDQQFVKYTEETNSWTILDRPPFNPGFHGYDHGAIDVSRRHYYWAQVGQADLVWQMDMITGVWRQLPNAPLQAGQFTSIDYFPEIDRLVYFDALGAPEYVLYTPDGDRWEERTAIADAPFGAISHFSEHNPTHGVMLFGGGYHYTDDNTPEPTPDIDESRRLYMLDRDRVVTRLADAPTFLGQFGAGPVQTIDPNSGNLVVFQGKPNEDSPLNCLNPLPIWEYDPDTNTWGQTGTQQLFDIWCRMNTVAVPLYEYGVNFIVSVRSDTDCRVHLYRHSSGTAPLNISVQPAAVTVEQGQTATFNIMAVGSGILSYQWRKNGVDIDGATAASYSLTALEMADNGAMFDVVVSNATESVISSAAALTIIVDTLAPTLQSVFAVNNSLVDIVFSEPVSTSSAQNIANYQVDLGIDVTSANLSDDGRIVSLTVSLLTADTVYTVLVSNVQDRAQTPNTIVAQSSKSFTYRTADGFEGATAEGWTPLTASRWSVVIDEGDQAYYLNTTDFNNLEVGRLGEYSLLSAEPGDFTFSAQAKLGDSVVSNAFADYAVVFGFQDENNYYYAMFNNTQSATQLAKIVDGSRTELVTAEIDWLTDNLYHSVEVSRIGSDISVRFDGNLIISVNDSTFGAGKVGVGSYNDSAYFDDVSLIAAQTADTTVPLITLNGDNPQIITIGNAYTELGVTAIDNRDGNISDDINIDFSAVDTSTEGSYNVNYNVSDASGNPATEVIRIVNVIAMVDNAIPVITLIGNNPQTITVGRAYSELGASAFDSVDGNISGNLTIDASAVDTTTVGSYSVRYNVSDAAANAATPVVRTVNVVAAPVSVPEEPNAGGGALGLLGGLSLILLAVRSRHTRGQKNRL